jgi:preprotein translocase subunit SecG
MGYLLLGLLAFVGFFLIFVILLQRGRGGGLAGAFGGLGGQSAFGTKAGDVFTVITIVTVVIWVILACLAGWRLRVEDKMYYGGRADVIKIGGETPADSNTEDGTDETEKTSDVKTPAGAKAGKTKTGAEEGQGEKGPSLDEGGDAKTDTKKTAPGNDQQQPAPDGAPGKSPSDGN